MDDVPFTGLDPENLIAPGMMASHYAPRATLRLNADSAQAGETLLGFGPAADEGGQSPDRKAHRPHTCGEEHDGRRDRKDLVRKLQVLHDGHGILEALGR